VRERQRRDDRQSAAQSEQSRHQTRDNAGDQIDRYKFHRRNRRFSLPEDPKVSVIDCTFVERLDREGVSGK
jgi:hypothetical protein